MSAIPRDASISRLLVDLDHIGLDSRLIGDKVHATLTLFLLKLERDTTDWSLLDPLHQMGGKSSDLVAETLRRDDGDFFEDLLVRVEVECHARVILLDDLARRFLHGLGTDTPHLSVYL